MCGECSPSNHFCDLIFELDLSQIIKTATHKQGNILDLVLTNLETNLINIDVYSDPMSFPSDHFAITFEIATAAQPSQKSGSFLSFNFARGNYVGLCDFLHNYDFTPSFLSHDVNYIWLFIEEAIKIVMYEFILVIKIGPKSSPKWFTSEINHQIKCVHSPSYPA